MTRDTIVINCRRLISFFKDNDKYADFYIIHPHDVSNEGLLKAYGRILDVNGAPVSYMSRLYLGDNEFNEFKEFAKSLDGYKDISSERGNGISFNYDGYNWIVENK